MSTVTALDGSVRPLPSIGLAVTTIGRPAIRELLRSAADSTLPPKMVAVADQSGGALEDLQDVKPFGVRVVPSARGISAGRNDAARTLGGDVDILGFPNDDTVLPPTCLESVARCFAEHSEVVAVALSLLDAGRPRFRLPVSGSRLTRLTVWRAIEPATFVRASAFRAVGGFDERIGAGAPTPWQSGEGTDLLLRLLEAGGTVLSRPDIAVLGRGERRNLSADGFVAKHRAYARGTGHVYRIHRYPFVLRWRIIGGPWIHFTVHDGDLLLSVRVAAARSIGRVEGLTGRAAGHTR